MSPRIIQGGKPVQVTLTRTVGHHPEIVTEVEFEVFACPKCEKVYKTEGGLERHLADKH